MSLLRGSSLAVPAPGPSRRIARELAARGPEAVRRHWLFAALAGCATALRAVVQLAYQPALIFPDSERYLQYAWRFVTGHWSPDWLRTSGYSLLLIPAVLTRNLAVVAAAQHLLGLATAALIYAAAVHLGARRWLAASATVPVLFDPLQLDLEQYVLTDVSATFLLVAALVVLVWKRDAIGNAAPAVAGLLLAAATIVRESDLLLMIPAVLYLAVAVRPWRRRCRVTALLLAGFVPVVLGYLGWHQASYGRFDFTDYDSQFMYGRIALFIDCAGVPLPRYERPLCPRPPPAQRNVDFYMWDPRSPQVTLRAPPGMNKGQIILDFDRRILEHQPLAYLHAVLGDVVYGFSPVRGDGPEHYPAWYLQFHPYFPAEKGKGELATIRASTGRGPYVQPALAGFLTGYGRDFYVPGPLLAAGLALGVAGLAGIGRARRSGLRAPCLLFTTGAIAATVPPLLIATFDWRYELPQLALIPIAAVLGVTAVAGQGGDRAPVIGQAGTGRPVRAIAPPGPANRAWPTQSRDIALHKRTGEAGRSRGTGGDVPEDLPPAWQPGEMRASDADRDRVADALRAAARDGRLTAGEFDERLEAAWSSRTVGELHVLTADLGRPAPAEGRIAQRGGSVNRTGRWVVPRRLELRTSWCDVSLDFTDAVITHDTLDIDLNMRGGSLLLVSPPGTVVDAESLAVRYADLDLPGPRASATLRVQLAGRMRYGWIGLRQAG